MSDVALPNGQVNKWIVDRQPTALDANANGAVRIRKYPTERSSAAVHWSYIGPNVPWQHCHDWQGLSWVTFRQPSQDDADSDGLVMVVARGEMPVLVDWKVAWNNADQWSEYYGWTHTDKWHEEALTQNQPSTDLQRLYISVSRSYGPRGQHIIDAVASDGTAWYLEADKGVWHQHPPLPPVQ